MQAGFQSFHRLFCSLKKQQQKNSYHSSMLFSQNKIYLRVRRKQMKRTNTNDWVMDEAEWKNSCTPALCLVIHFFFLGKLLEHI